MAMLIVHSADFEEKVTRLQDHLQDKIAVSLLSSFSEATDYCKTQMPDMVFVQNQLEDGNAFDFCTRIRLLQNQQLVPIIVFSDKLDSQERVRTFQVGADEYISEFDIDYVSALVEHELESNLQRKQLEQEKEMASNLVVEAMRASSELGNAMNFIERCHQFKDAEAINAEIIKFCSKLDLNVVIGTLEHKHWLFSSTNGNVTELERDLMQSIHNQVQHH